MACDGSFGRRKRIIMPNLINVGMYARLFLPFENMGMIPFFFVSALGPNLTCFLRGGQNRLRCLTPVETF